MLETIRSLQKTWLAKLILAAITIPFALWGIESYVQNPGGQDTVASVGKEKINSIEFNEAVRRQLDQFKSQFGNNIDASIMDNPEMRKGVLDQLIDQKLFTVASQNAGVKVTDAGLRDRIASEPSFQENGVFTPARYETFLKANGKTATMFEAELRRDLERNQFANSIGNTGFTSKASVTAFMMAAEQSREVAMVNVNPEQFIAQVKVTPEQVKAYYDGNVKEFTIAEQVKPEYVELSIDALASSIKIPAEEVKKYYEANATRYVVKEQRKASHILINAAPTATDAAKKEAKAKADSLYEQAKKDIKSFADLAKKNSQDPGSGAAGGDLGFFGRGAMVKPFDEAVFNAKKGDLIPPVLSDFGYHVILVTDIRPETGKSLAEVTPEIEGELKKQSARGEYAKLAEKFSTAAFEQSSSLKGAAEVAGVAIKQGPWISKGQGLPPFNNPKLMTALFSDQVIKDKRNSEAVETAPNTLVVARALEFKPSSVKPFADVEKSITAKLTREEAGKLAKKDGEAKLAELKAGKTVADLKWPALLAVSRANPGGLPPQVLDAALKLDAKTVPAYTGADNPAGGYTIVQVAKVIEAPAPDEAKLKALTTRVAQTVSQQEFLSLLAVARTKTDVTIKKDALDKKADGTTGPVK
ncbi:MAG: SurA N-terminal domain-containing protein [Betaproteobacteria bacterium]|nr:SurA N-terminal domain-containing protein [Betaproteobacteria bacterium]